LFGVQLYLAYLCYQQERRRACVIKLFFIHSIQITIMTNSQKQIVATLLFNELGVTVANIIFKGEAHPEQYFATPISERRFYQGCRDKMQIPSLYVGTFSDKTAKISIQHRVTGFDVDGSICSGYVTPNPLKLSQLCVHNFGYVNPFKTASFIAVRHEESSVEMYGKVEVWDMPNIEAYNQALISQIA
jgi:hypothetical protein